MKRQRIWGMNAHVLMYVLLPIGLILLIHICLLVVNRPAYLQKPDEIVTREPGNRLLGPPRDAGPEAREDLPFALLSQAAYKKPIDARKIEQGTALDPDATLEQMGWCRWKDFPTGHLQESFDGVHLRLQVWSNAAEKKIVVAFGGTVARNAKDWISDMRWFIPYHRDQYTMIVDRLGKEFIAKYLDGNANCNFSPDFELFSTGHSLGGGLAQEFAYSLPESDFVHPVTKVYAFDPSPVTGFSSVAKGLRDYNRKNLKIDRIYERGEILSIFRSLTHFVDPPAYKAPVIRQVRYNLFYTMNPFAGHSMAEFALKLYQTSLPKEPPPVS